MKLLHRIADSAAAIAGGLIILLMLAQFAIVVLRYLFAFGFSWGLDLLSYLFMTASLLPLFLVVLDNHNVRVDVFYQGYPTPAKALLDRTALLLLLPACAYTACLSWPALINSWHLLEASPTLGGLPGYFLLKTLQFASFAGLSVVAALLVLCRTPWDYSQPQDTGGEPS